MDKPLTTLVDNKEDSFSLEQDAQRISALANWHIDQVREFLVEIYKLGYNRGADDNY